MVSHKASGLLFASEKFRYGPKPPGSMSIGLDLQSLHAPARRSGVCDGGSGFGP
jgi:hypothetical protein